MMLGRWLSFFKTLKMLSSGGDGGEIPSFLSTHPDPLDRYENVGKMAAEWQAKVPMAILQDQQRYISQMVDGITYGEDPRQGYVESNAFYHPELKFQYPVPAKLGTWPTVQHRLAWPRQMERL